MGRVSTGPSVLTIIVTSDCPVKNTFIHYSGAADCNRVKRFTTAPESRNLASLRRQAPLEPFHDTSHCSEASENLIDFKPMLSSSTSEASLQDASSAATTDLSHCCNEVEASKTHSTWSLISTPEASPRHSFAPPTDSAWSPISTPETSPRRSSASWANSAWSSISTPEASPSLLSAHCTTWGPPALWIPTSHFQLPQPSFDAQSQSLDPSCVPEEDTFLFSFTIRRVIGGAWGVELKRDVINEAWLVTGLTSHGAIGAWNELAMYSDPEKALRVGDLIVSVNDRQDWSGMLREFGRKEMLKLTMLRIKSCDADKLLTESEHDLAHRFF